MNAQPKPNYETVDRARDASCFRCYGDLVDFCRSGFDIGDGDTQGFCEACRMPTFFNCTEE